MFHHASATILAGFDFLPVNRCENKVFSTVKNYNRGYWLSKKRAGNDYLEQYIINFTG